MIKIESYISEVYRNFPWFKDKLPWEITPNLHDLIWALIKETGPEFTVTDGVAVHKSAVIETNVTLKAPVIIGKNCFIGANAYLRGGVCLEDHVSIGPGCEIKSSVIFSRSALAHFNFVGDSIVGCNVNFEAGSITANHFNERENKDIFVLIASEVVNSGVQKFGALIGDNCRIGANAVLSPGTILQRGSVVKRLELVDQVGEHLKL